MCLTMKEIEIPNNKYFILKPNGLEIKENTPIDEWIKCGEALRKISGASQWWIGDWINFGERKYGEMYSQALEKTDYELHSLQNMAYTAKNIESSLRREDVPFSYYKQLASVEDKEKILKKIEKGDINSDRELRQEIKKLNTPKRKITSKAEIKIYHDDFRNNKIQDNSIDLILTDPPYPKEFRPLWEDLAKEAARVLKPGGFLIAYSGQNGLPDIIKMMEKHLNYYWLGNLYHKGSVAQRFEVNMFNRGKPILFFFKPPLKKQEGWIDDVQISEQPDKDMHEWGQSVEPLIKILEAFSQEGDLILDPFFGGGSVIEASAKTNRNFIGFEIDKEYYNLVKKRIND